MATTSKRDCSGKVSIWKVELSLPHLYPIGKERVIFGYLIGKLSYIAVTVLPDSVRLPTRREPLNLVYHPVDERDNTVDKRNLGPLLEIPALVVDDMDYIERVFLVNVLIFVVHLTHICIVSLLPPFKRFEERGQRIALVGSAPQTVKGEQQKDDDDNHHHNRENHDVELSRRLSQLVSTRLKIAVLTGLFLKVEVDIAVIIALMLVVDGRVDHTQLLTDRGYKVRSLRYGLILLQGIVEASQGRIVVVNLPVAGGQGAIGTGYLIHVAEGVEQIH